MKLENHFKATISRYLIASMLLLLMLSCQIRGLTNDYGKLSPVEKSRVVALKNFENLSKDTIYKINALQLKEEL